VRSGLQGGVGPTLLLGERSGVFPRGRGEDRAGWGCVWIAGIFPSRVGSSLLLLAAALLFSLLSCVSLLGLGLYFPVFLLSREGAVVATVFVL
ncbi:MAG: hypothetical protein ACTJLK_04705, partial [Anaplasma sp.]